MYYCNGYYKKHKIIEHAESTSPIKFNFIKYSKNKNILGKYNTPSNLGPILYEFYTSFITSETTDIFYKPLNSFSFNDDKKYHYCIFSIIDNNYNFY